MWIFSKEKEKEESPVIEALKERINNQKMEMEATKLLLKEARKPPKEEKLFIESRPMRAYLRTVRFITGPLACLHDRADQAYENPTEYRRDRLLEDARELLNVCSSHADPGLPKRKSLTAQASNMVMELEAESRRGAWKKATAILKSLREEVERLRPDGTEEGASARVAIEEAMERTMESIRSEVKKSKKLQPREA